MVRSDGFEGQRVQRNRQSSSRFWFRVKRGDERVFRSQGSQARVDAKDFAGDEERVIGRGFSSGSVKLQG